MNNNIDKLIKNKFKLLLDYDIPDRVIHYIKDIMDNKHINVDEAIKMFLTQLIEIYNIDMFNTLLK